MPQIAAKIFLEICSKYETFNLEEYKNAFLKLDCKTGESLINPIFILLEITLPEIFEKSMDFILENCINVNRRFSDAVEFLAIGLKKFPNTRLEKLKNPETKQYFNRTEYGYEGNNGYFPKLLQEFSILINEDNTADKILDYLFETFDFFNIPDVFVMEVMGYDRLQLCIEDCPSIFK